jgi:hypothetical protein
VDPATVWKFDFDDNLFKTTSNVNEPLSFSFTGIDNTNDVCFKIKYNAPQPITLDLKYHGSKRMIFSLFKYSIVGNNSLNFCLRNFLLSYDTEFTISISLISANTSPFEVGLNYEEFVVKKSSPFKYYMSHWSENHKLSQYISSYSPSDFFNIPNSETSLNLKCKIIQ